MKPWKRVGPPTWPRTMRRGFNGATAMKPWKRTYGENKSSAIGNSFNGATAMKPWKRPEAENVNAPPVLLQWGHGDEAVEEVPCDMYPPPP